MGAIREEDWAAWNAGFRPWTLYRGTIRQKAVLGVANGIQLPETHKHHYADDAIQKYLQRQHHDFRRLLLVSDVHFYRACPDHLDEVKAAEGSNSEILMCPHGHRVTSWVTMCSDGRVIGQAWKNRDSMVVGSREKPRGPRRPTPPSQPCMRGHMDWTYSASQRSYYCASCKERRGE